MLCSVCFESLYSVSLSTYFLSTVQLRLQCDPHVTFAKADIASPSCLPAYSNSISRSNAPAMCPISARRKDARPCAVRTSSCSSILSLSSGSEPPGSVGEGERNNRSPVHVFPLYCYLTGAELSFPRKGFALAWSMPVSVGIPLPRCMSEGTWHRMPPRSVKSHGLLVAMSNLPIC